MNLRTIVLAIISLSVWQPANAQSRQERGPQTNNHESIRAVGQSQAGPRARTRAKAKITVQSSEAKPYDQTVSPALMEIRLSETFTGDLEGESPVRALQVRSELKQRLPCRVLKPSPTTKLSARH